MHLLLLLLLWLCHTHSMLERGVPFPLYSLVRYRSNMKTWPVAVNVVVLLTSNPATSHVPASCVTMRACLVLTTHSCRYIDSLSAALEAASAGAEARQSALDQVTGYCDAFNNLRARLTALQVRDVWSLRVYRLAIFCSLGAS